MDNHNVNLECRTLECTHKFCAKELKTFIMGNLTKEKIDCPICSDMPVQDRKFFDENHDKSDIALPEPMIQDLLTREEYDNYLNIKMLNYKPADLEKEFLFVCNGYVLAGKDGAEKVVDKTQINRIMDGYVENLPFQIENCTVRVVIEKRLNLEKYTCPNCQIEFCLKCSSRSHDGTCEKFAEWKVQQAMGDKAIEDLLVNQPNQFKRCPKC